MSKIYGTTLYLGEKHIKTDYGDFIAKLYQDLITNKYIIALIDYNTNFLNYDDDVLYTRIHSSCVTSEMFQSQDCDCVQQLNTAIKYISENGGILFYLIQEGRGCGYIGKARACQMVQYHEYHDNEFTTFDAYHQLGMKPDYRQYHNIKEILHLLNIEDKKFILLTNNPDKINGLKKLGVNIEDVNPIEFEPNIFNRSYLISKQRSGHKLEKIFDEFNTFFQLDPKNNTNTLKDFLPHKPHKPFDPYHLKNENRLIYCAKYYLPIKAYDNIYVLSDKQIDSLDDIEIFDHYCKVKSDTVNKNKIINPYWFEVNLHFDIVNNLDYVLLKYEDPFNEKKNIPIVRIHSESILDRFPLSDNKFKNRYRKSIQEIVKNGYGYILLFYRDGRGNGLGYYLLNKSLKNDLRDYDIACKILKNEFGTSTFHLMYTNFSKYSLKKKCIEYNLKVNNWIPLEKNDIIDKIFNLDKVVKYVNFLKFTKFQVKSNINYYIYEIGNKTIANIFYKKIIKEFGNVKYLTQDELYNLCVKDNQKIIIISDEKVNEIDYLFNKFNEDNIYLIGYDYKKCTKNLLLYYDNHKICTDILNYLTVYKYVNDYFYNIDCMKLYDLAKSINYNLKFQNSKLILIFKKIHIDDNQILIDLFYELFQVSMIEITTASDFKNYRFNALNTDISILNFTNLISYKNNNFYNLNFQNYKLNIIDYYIIFCYYYDIINI